MGKYIAFFDESGTHGGSEALIVAGYVSSIEQWKMFEHEWQGLLSDAGIGIFHMKDFAHSKREFEIWKDEEDRRVAFLEKAIKVLRNNVRNGFSCAVILKDYHKVNEQYLLQEYVGSPYTLAALTCVNRGNKWIKEHKYIEPIVNVFEDGVTGKGEFIDAMKKHNQPAPIFKKKSECISFQVADFAAYELYKRYTGLLLNESRRVRKSYEKLYSMPTDWRVMEKTSLVQVCQKNRIPLRNTLLSVIDLSTYKSQE